MKDMLGISIDVAWHQLNIDPSFKIVKQKRRKLGLELAKVINNVVMRFLGVGSIREIKYHKWLTNTVFVKKKDGK